MLADRPDFREWLAKHDAHGFHMAQVGGRNIPKEGEAECECCGGPLADTPSQLREHCIVCLAERFGGDLVEEQMVNLFVGGMVKAALKSDEIVDDVVVTTVQEALRDEAHERGLSWGRMSCGREA